MVIELFIVAMKEAIQWKEATDFPSKSRKYFPNLKLKTPVFPLIEWINEIVLDEWRKVDKRPDTHNRFYVVPMVHASVMRLPLNTTLPLEDTLSFRDILNCRIDSDLKKMYHVTEGAWKSAVALTSVSSAARTWTDNIELAL